jgi:uncharacterized protein
MARTGYADLPLHHGHVPPWLAERMSSLGKAIVEAIVLDYGKGEVLRRLSDPFWFQALGCVMGMDWHSSGITTSVMGALKKAVNPMSAELGIYICGGKGRYSRQTPDELMRIAGKTGMDGDQLVRSSKLAAKVDNTAIQDGFQLYLHSFVLTDEGEWAVVQQGMNDSSSMARRYHWHSAHLQSFVSEPHAFIYGQNQGLILNMTDKEAVTTRDGVLEIAKESPSSVLPEIKRLVMPSPHGLTEKDVNLKRLGAVLAVAHEKQLPSFEDLLLLEGLGPRTLQSLVLVSEVIHGTPSRFTDPARFSFAHGGKDGHPFPVPTKVYDETLHTLHDSIRRAKIGVYDKHRAVKSLQRLSQLVEQDFEPNASFREVIEKERAESWKYGGRTVSGKARPPGNQQLKLF